MENPESSSRLQRRGGRGIWDTYVTEVGTVALTGGDGGSDLGSTTGTGRAAEGGGVLGASDLVGGDVLLVGGDGDTSLSVGEDVDGLGVGKTRVLVRGQVQEVAL